MWAIFRRFQPIYLNLANKPEWYLEQFPAGRVPALLYKEKFLYESLLLSDFLDEEFPHPPLYPSDKIKKIQDKIFVQNLGKVSLAHFCILGFHWQVVKFCCFLCLQVQESYYKVAFVEYNVGNFAALITDLEKIEEELKERKTKFFGGTFSVPQLCPQ